MEELKSILADQINQTKMFYDESTNNKPSL